MVGPEKLVPAPEIQTSRAGLLRQLGFFSATALVISNMVGSGIFGFTGFMAGDLGSAGLILACWGAGALFAFCGALSYSELGINFPSSGGEYVYLTNALGPEWGFMNGVISQPKASLTALCTAGVGALVYRLWKRSHPPVP